MVDASVWESKVTVEFLLDNLRFDFSRLNDQTFSYEANPVLRPLNQQDPMKVYRYNPGSFIQLEVSFQARRASRPRGAKSLAHRLNVPFSAFAFSGREPRPGNHEGRGGGDGGGRRVRRQDLDQEPPVLRASAAAACTGGQRQETRGLGQLPRIHRECFSRC